MKLAKILSVFGLILMLAACNTPDPAPTPACDNADFPKPTDTFLLDSTTTPGSNYAIKFAGAPLFNAEVSAYAVIFTNDGNAPTVFQSQGTPVTDTNGQIVLKFLNPGKIKSTASVTSQAVVQFQTFSADKKTVLEAILVPDALQRVKMVMSSAVQTVVATRDPKTCKWNGPNTFNIPLWTDVNLEQIAGEGGRQAGSENEIVAEARAAIAKYKAENH